MITSFTHTYLPVIERRVMRLGLAFKYGIDGSGIEEAIDAGANVFMASQMVLPEQVEVVRAALGRSRSAFTLMSGPTFAYLGGQVRRGVERLLERFDVACLDILMVYWVGRMSALTRGVVREMVRARDQGLTRAIGVTIHDRKRAALLAKNSPLDLIMVRYNAAHPGAEQDTFPAYQTRRPMSFAYTATAWGKLLRPVDGSAEAPMRPADCYRFCLSNPNVDVVFCGARSGQEFRENVDALAAGPLSPAEERRFRRFGKLAHGVSVR